MWCWDCNVILIKLNVNSMILGKVAVSKDISRILLAKDKGRNVYSGAAVSP